MVKWISKAADFAQKEIERSTMNQPQGQIILDIELNQKHVAPLIITTFFFVSQVTF